MMDRTSRPRRERWLWGLVDGISVGALGCAVVASLFLVGAAAFDALSTSFLGVATSVLGTLGLSTLALLVAAPVAIGTALWARWLAPVRLRPTFLWLISLLGDVPPVVWAVSALVVLQPKEGVEAYFLAVLALGAVAAPSIAARGLRVFETVSPSRMLAAYALGASQAEAVIGVVLPAVWRGLARAILVGFSRAFADTVIVLLLLGPLWIDAPVLPLRVVDPTLSELALPGALAAAVVWGLVALAISMLARRVLR
ncbi:MAG: hypothetical protein EA397_06415 [Deltaproteobacteria bacterium]|nr:MAG: hypothetical protein EA397_06415 [Deltaproteobacteria bacterium]